MAVVVGEASLANYAADDDNIALLLLRLRCLDCGAEAEVTDEETGLDALTDDGLDAWPFLETG